MNEAPAAAFGRRATLRAALQMTGSTYVVYATGLIVSALVARHIGPDDFGRYSYLIWLVGLLIMVGNNGLTTSAIRFVSESLGRGEPRLAEDVHGWLKRRQLACIALVLALYLVSMPFFTPAGWSGSDWVLSAGVVLAATFAKAMYLFSISVAKGHGRFDVEASTSVVVSVLNAIAVIVLISLHAGLHAYLVLFALASVGYALSAAWVLHRAGIHASHRAIPADLLARMRHHLVWTVVLTMAAAFSNKSVETWMLNQFVGPAEVGYFAIAAALTRGGVDLLSSGLTTVLMPSMAHAFGATGHDSVNTILSHSVRYFLFLGLLLAGAGVLWADVAVRLMYGPRYEAVVPVLQVMMVVGGVTLSDGAFGALLSTTDNQRLRAGFSFLSIVLGTLAAVALVPTWGLFGAVAAHALSRISVFTITLAGIVRLMHLRLPWREITRLCASAVLAFALAMAIVVLLPGLWSSAIAGAVYVGAYVCGTALLRAWKRGDAETLLGLFDRLPAPLLGLRPRLEQWAQGLPD